jgi:hypothetical protein
MAEFHPFYRFWFTTLDPIFSATVPLGALFAPALSVKSFAPPAALPPSIEATVLLTILSGFFCALILLEVYLLRARPNDLAVWNSVQAGTLIVDVHLLYTLAKVLGLDPRTWRVEEWANVVFTSWVAVLRIVFLMGVGIKRLKAA